jgi:hypothetical protein
LLDKHLENLPYYKKKFVEEKLPNEI